MTLKRTLALVALFVLVLPVGAAAQPLSFDALQARAAGAPPHASPLHAGTLVNSGGAKAEIPQQPPYADFYVSVNPDTEQVSLRMFVSNIKFTPPGPLGVRLDGKGYGTLPQRNGLLPNEGSAPGEYTLETLVKANLSFGTTRARLTIPFSRAAYYAFNDAATAPLGDFFDACIVPDANGNSTGFVDVYTRLRGYSLGAPSPQAAYVVKSKDFEFTMTAATGNNRPSAVWLYGHMSINDYYAYFAAVPGASGTSAALSVQIQALGNQWVAFESWYPVALGICAKG